MGFTRRTILISTATLAVAALAACTLAEAKGNDKKATEDDPARVLDANSVLGTPVTYKNLTVIPVLARKDIKDARNYLTLDEAFAGKLVKVRELDDESVNSLSLENLSDRPMFVMSGEVILGGKQDRIIGKDRLIPPKTAEIVDVYCVEHGRWTEEGGSRNFRSAKTLAHTDLRNKASYEDQSEVWNEVAKKNAARGTENDTDTYRAVTKDKDAEKRANAYRDHIEPALDKTEHAERMIGIVVAQDGVIIGVESFGTPALFSKMRPKLLRSYYVAAIDAPAPKDPKAAAKIPVAADVTSFLAADAEAEEEKVVDDKAGSTVRKKGKTTGESKVKDAEPAAASPDVYSGKHRL